jgi:hypothetical protein
MKRNKLFSALALIALGVIGIAAALNGQTSGLYPDLDKNGKPLIPRPNPFIWWSPTDLAHNAVTLPASNVTTNTNIVPTSGATALTYYVSCTQIAKVTVNVYTADDIASPQANNPAPNKGYTLYGSYDLVTAVPAAAHQVFIGTELAPSVTGGTLPANVAFRLPQAAVSFSETNAGATPGTCTGRLAVKYN